MAKTTGTQSIPSALLEKYRATLGVQDPKKLIGKRYPYRIPPMQTVAGHPSKKQIKQRSRFNQAKADFTGTGSAERARWYAAEPEWGSFLWYYNYFIMSSLLGNANLSEGGAGLIKSIQHKLISMPAGSGEGSVAITSVDVDKTVVMINGSSLAIDDEAGVFWASTVFPYVSSLATTLLKCKWCIAAPYTNNTKAATISCIIIEYI